MNNVANADALLVGEDLCCIRERRVLFESLNFALSRGSILMIEGANGSGKSSLLRIICGLLPPQQGRVVWRGQAIHETRERYYSELLYIGHLLGLKDDLSALENLLFYQSLHGGTGDPEEALDCVGLAGYEDTLVRSLSAGQKRRIVLARLWLNEAPLWLLDEPLTALDSKASRHLQIRLQAQADAGGIVVLTSHQALRLTTVRRLSLGSI